MYRLDGLTVGSQNSAIQESDYRVASFDEYFGPERPSSISYLISRKKSLHETPNVVLPTNEEFAISEAFRDQQPLTVAQITEAAKELSHSIPFEFFMKNYEITDKRKIKILVYLLNVFLERLEKQYKIKDIHVPFGDKTVREVLSNIFTNTINLDSKSIYKILSTFNAYALFHSFCTQMVPIGLNFDFAKTRTEKPVKAFKNARKIMRIFGKDKDLPFVSAEKNYFSPEQKWLSNDEETRIKIAEEMFQFIKEYLHSHSDENVTIIEPGGGNAEFTAILAQKICEDTITRNRVTIIVKEFSKEMIHEGKNKLDRLKKKLANIQGSEIDLGVFFIEGSAETSLNEQLTKIKKLVSLELENELLNQYSLTLTEAIELLKRVIDTKVIGAISTYAFGAMIDPKNPDLATNIATRTIRDVSSQGKVIFTDFAERPPDQYILDEQNATIKNEIREKRKIFDLFANFGFAQGLAINLGFWEHDVIQIWKILHSLKANFGKQLQVSSEIDLKPFALLPLAATEEIVDSLAIPGYFEMIMRTNGLGDPTSKIRI